MVRFSRTRHADPAAAADEAGDQAWTLQKADAVGTEAAVELGRRDELRTLEAAPFFPLPSPRDILCDPDGQAEEEDPQATPHGGHQKVQWCLIPVNPVAQKVVQLRVIVLAGFPNEAHIADAYSGRIDGKRRGAHLARDGAHLIIEGEPGAAAVDHVQHAIGAAPCEDDGHRAPKIRRQVEPLERRPGRCLPPRRGVAVGRPRKLWQRREVHRSPAFV